ncbi:MAG: hypothetical protein ACI4LP_07835 [Anaerovoracaceae bacterium]
MDRNYYYRILGVREDATAQQIKQGYEERVKRLKSPDYADDPEYVDRKLREAAYAYRALLGGEAPSSDKQRKKGYEKLKNSMEKDETSGGAKPFERAGKPAGTRLKKKAGRTVSSVSGSKEAKSALGIAISVLVAVISLAVGSCDTYSTPDYTYEDTAYMESNRQAVERILNRSEEYDCFGHLDGSNPVPDEKIEWEITDEISEELWGLNIDLCSALDIFSLHDAVCWYMDDEDYYYEASDYEISQLLAEIMGAPAFEEVAGMTVTDTDQVITDYSDYMRFLIDIAWEQTDLICGEPVDY